MLFFKILSLNQNFIRIKMKMGTRLHKFLNNQKFCGTLLANCVGDLGREYVS